MHKDCLFCQIIKGEKPSTKIYEDDKFLAFQALFQASKGHTLIIPKEHSEDILEMKPELGTEMIKLAQDIGNATMQGLGAKGFNIGVNVKEMAGQVIFHTHMHIIPRFENDGLEGWDAKEASDEEMTLFAGKIIENMK